MQNVFILGLAALALSSCGQSAKAEQPLIVTDFMCGLYRVQINSEPQPSLMLNRQPYGDYRNSTLDKANNYVHRFGEKAEIRVTQYSRVAFRLVGETRWAACKPLVMYQEQTQ